MRKSWHKYFWTKDRIFTHSFIGAVTSRLIDNGHAETLICERRGHKHMKIFRIHLHLRGDEGRAQQHAIFNFGDLAQRFKTDETITSVNCTPKEHSIELPIL